MQSNYHNLPVVNGIPQKYGRKYKAQDAEASPNEFRLNLKEAYPAEAGIKDWIRSYQLKNNQLVIRDKFSLEEAIAPNQINFMTWGNISIEGNKVSISRENISATIKFNPDEFEASKETIPLTDPTLSNVWGKEIYRISFTAKRLSKEGNYKFTVSF